MTPVLCVIFTALCKGSAKHSFASAVYATANSSVRPSVSPPHAGAMSKRRNAEGCGLHHRVAQCLQFSVAKNGWWGMSMSSWNLSAKRSTLCENSRAVHISPHNSGTVIDSEKCSITANRKSTMGFPTSHQPRSCVTPNFPKYPRYPNLAFFA